MAEEKDDREDVRSDWLSHPYTQMWAEKAPAAAKKALDALTAAASQSTDPKVLAAYTEWKEKATFALWLTTGVRR